MTDLHWPQDFRHLDIIGRDGRGRPSFSVRDGFNEHVVAKDGKWYEIISLPKDAPGRESVMTPRKVKPLENEALLHELGSADEHCAQSAVRQEEAANLLKDGKWYDDRPRKGAQGWLRDAEG